MRVLVRRLRAACRTNEPQATVVIGLTVLNGIALSQRTSETPGWLVIAALLFWPVFAFVANVIDPIPGNDNT